MDLHSQILHLQVGSSLEHNIQYVSCKKQNSSFLELEELAIPT